MANRSKSKTVGYGFVHTWNDGTLGWWLPRHLCGHGRAYPDRPEVTAHNQDDPMYLCKVTVELVRDKRGRPIVRYPKKGDT